MKFSDLKEKILATLQEKSEQLGLLEPCSLVEGFTMIYLVSELPAISVGGNGVPAIMLVGEKTGKIYQIALRILLPDLKI